MAIFFATLPWITVAIVVGVVTALSTGMPWVLSFMTGLMLNAISPSVVVPLMLKMILTG